MLSEITIKNFAIIDELSLTFASGFNVLTGETGAGKSIILDAVSLLLGGRSDSTAVRSGAEMAILEASFVLSSGPLRDRIAEILKREEVEGETPEHLLLTREIRKGGRSVCRVNGHTVNVNVLKDISEGLVDIHGQTEHLTLLKPSSHIDLLDRFGGLLGKRAEFSRLVKEVEQIRAELRDLTTNEKLLKQRSELLAYKVQEIRAASLKPGEDEDLRVEAKRLGAAEQLAALTSEAYQAIYEAPEGTLCAADLVSQAASAAAKLVKYDAETQELADQAETLSVQIEELARTLADYLERIEFDPSRLRDVEMRMDLIANMKRKYDVETIEQLVTAADDAERELSHIENSAERIQQLQADEQRVLAEIGRQGAVLSSAREAVADKLARAVEAELGDLRMQDARFGVSIEHVDDPEGAPVGDYRVAFTQYGIDKVEFLIAPNLGEPLHPVAKIASGGETSRIMLSLKEVLSRADETPTLIFDEIDAGIGGRIGAVVGQKLWSLSHDHQVLVVTHLPQLAGFADAHFKVEKLIQGKRTVTQITRLVMDAQVEELTQMLGAEAESARQSAQEILKYVQQIKQQNKQAEPQQATLL
jgi:DNA repair protein RecN (Recombination protein N)